MRRKFDKEKVRQEILAKNKPWMPPKDDRAPRVGWAPGGYLCECSKCHIRFIGDKRATMCADCAYRITDEEIANASVVDGPIQVHIPGWRDMPKETQDALVKMFQIIADNYAKGINPAIYPRNHRPN